MIEPAVAQTIHLDGLLHLAALCVAVTAAYVGFDRIKAQKDEFATALADMKERVRIFVEAEFDIKCSAHLLVKQSLRLSSVIVLCHIAHANTRTRWWKWPLHFYIRQRRVPCYRYFYGRNDMLVMTLACVFSLLSFLFLVAIQVYDLDASFWTTFKVPILFGITVPLNLAKVFFLAYSIIICLVFLSAYLSSNLQLEKLEERCRKLFASALKQRDRFSDNAMSEAEAYKPKRKAPAQMPAQIQSNTISPLLYKGYLIGVEEVHGRWFPVVTRSDGSGLMVKGEVQSQSFAKSDVDFPNVGDAIRAAKNSIDNREIYTPNGRS